MTAGRVREGESGRAKEREGEGQTVPNKSIASSEDSLAVMVSASSCDEVSLARLGPISVLKFGEYFE